jgi:uncharacterized protein (TIGR02466 family)
MKTVGLFTTYLYVWDIPDSLTINSALEKQAVELSENTKGITRSNVKGWHSDINIHLEPEYKHLFDFIESSLLNIFTSRDVKTVVPVIDSAWFNINQKGAFNQKHTHPYSFFSGIYYVKTPAKCGNLILEDPRPVEIHNPFPDSKYPCISIEPIAGRLYVFPAYLQHSVEPNESDENRISIAFNSTYKKI